MRNREVSASKSVRLTRAARRRTACVLLYAALSAPPSCDEAKVGGFEDRTGGRPRLDAEPTHGSDAEPPLVDMLAPAARTPDALPSDCDPWGHWALDLVCSDLLVRPGPENTLLVSCVDFFIDPKCDCSDQLRERTVSGQIAPPCTLVATLLQSYAPDEFECSIDVFQAILGLTGDLATGEYRSYGGVNTCEFYYSRTYPLAGKRVTRDHDAGAPP